MSVPIRDRPGRGDLIGQLATASSTA